MTPILYSSDEVDFLNNGLGQLVDLYDVDIHEQRNGLLNLTAYYPVNGQHYGNISEGNIILAKPSPLDDNHAFRIVSVELDITGYAVMIEADSITYDLTNNLSKTIHMLGDGQAAMTAIQKSTLHPHIFTFYSDITHTSESQLRYVNPMEAIAGTQGSFLQIWGGELKRENRRVAMFNRRGRDNVATFRLGKNIAGLKYTVDVSNLTTEIVPTVTVNSTDVSRTIEGATVQSSRMGNYPLVYSKMVDVSQDVKVDEGDTDDQIKAKINAFAADWFVKSANTGKDLPEVTVEVEVESLQDSADYADKFAKLETIGLTDTVTVYVPEFGVNVTAIVNELHYDPVAERVTKISIGTAKVSWADSNKNALNDLQDKVTEVKEQVTQAVISANGKNSIYSGRNEPEHPQEGDTWFWDDGTDSGIRVFTNGKWVDSTDTKTLERINNAVDGAIETSKTYTDELNEKQVQTTNALNEKVDKSVKELTDSQQAISSQATAYTNSAVADANAKAVQIGQTTAQNAQKALDEAKKDFTSSFASQASQAALMASEATSKASQYASQAKSEAVSAATSADGVVRTEFKSTTDSMTATIQKNKSDADGKISTAQTTATQALNGLSIKVSQTEYNTKTGQLQTDLTATTQTANQAKTDIVSIKQKDGEQDEKMNSIVSDVNGTKQTVSDLQTVQGKQLGDISTLQQRADGFEATVAKIQTSVNNLGQINQLFNTEFSPDFAGWVNSSRAPYVVDGSYNGSVRIRNTATEVGNRLYSELISVQGISVVSTSVYNDSWSLVRGYDENKKLIGELKANLISSQGLNVMNGIPIPSTVYYIEFGVQSGVNSYVSQPMLVFAPTVGSYVQGNYNNNRVVAKAQLTADQARVSINNYKTDADGRISKAQADIVANANAITQKVSQSDYNAKTGELTQSVSKAQQTADTATQTIGTYKESNDKRVTAAETNITANADAIKLTASKTELNQATGKLSGDISTLQQRADGFEATVAEIQTSVNNLGQINQLFNTEFSPDFAGWANGSRSPYAVDGSYNGSVRIRNTATVAGNRLYSELISVRGVSVVSTSVYNDSWSLINGYDENKKLIGELKANLISSQGLNVMNGVQIPSNVYYISFGIQSGVNSYVSQPMLVFASTVGSYVQGNYNNNASLAQVKITADGVYQTVNNPKTGLNTRVSTAEGNISKVQGTVDGMSNTVTETSNGLTREIADRKTGDSNTLQAGKDFTTSQIKNYDSGVQSQITQTANSIIAQVSNVQIRYLRIAADGNSGNTGNHYAEIALYSTNGTNLLAGKLATTTGYTVPSSYPIKNLTDGSTSTFGQIGDSAMSTQGRWAVFDVGSLVNPDYASVTPYFIDGRTHYNVVVQVSADNIYWRTIYQGAMQTVKNDAAKSTFRIPVNGNSASAFLGMFNDNWALGINDNSGALIAGINGDTSNVRIAAKQLIVSADTTFQGINWLDGAVIKDASISNAQIADASITSAKIVNLDVNKISGEVANFIRAYWDGQYGSTSITSEGMTVSAGVTATVFDENGMQLNKSNRSVGRIGVNDLYQDNSKKGLYFGLEATGDFMAWGAQNYAGNPYDTKLSWYRVGSVPSNLPGTIEGFNFQDNVLFNRPLEMRGGIKIQGTDDKLVAKTTTFNGFNYPTFGTSSAGLAYGSVETYLISNGTAYNLSKIIKALSGISSAAIPSGFTSDGKATGWYNINFK